MRTTGMNEDDTVPIAGQTEAEPRREPRRFWARTMVFIACVLLVDGLFGQHGLTETIRARRDESRAATDLVQLRNENDRQRDEVERLRDDPATIESVARTRLGLMREGEIQVTIHDAK
ncbi:MAG: FtsB family cell division protein [Vicinamibacterales bacterium]